MRHCLNIAQTFKNSCFKAIVVFKLAQNLEKTHTHKNSRRLTIIRLKMSVKRRLDNQSKLMCREKKQNGELFLPLVSHLARASIAYVLHSLYLPGCTK